MAKIETLTAYICKFSYALRNNPLLNEQREAIKAGKKPDYKVDDFIKEYQKYTENLAVGENSDRAISLTENKIFVREQNNVKIWHIIPSAGKQGKPVTVVKKNTGKKYAFDSDTAALYEHHVYIYESSNSIVAVFHRQNGSGCKSVFYETANKAIRHLGLKLEMELITLTYKEVKDAAPAKITLQYTKTEMSSDIADNMKKSKKKHVIRDIGLSLDACENSKILNILQNLQWGKIEKDEAFAKIKAELPWAKEYNDAQIKMKIGNRYRTVQWNDFEHMMGSYDITQKLNAACRANKKFEEALAEIADEYYWAIINAEE